MAGRAGHRSRAGRAGLGLGVLGAVWLSASAALAGTQLVNFDFTSGGASVAAGRFTYDSAATGTLSYADLSSFRIRFANGDVYDLAFVQSGDDSPYRYFGFDSATHGFVSQTVADYPQIMSDIKSSFTSGFFVRQDPDYRIVRDYAVNDNGVFYDTLKITVGDGGGGAVPEPAAWAVLMLGLGATGAVLRRRRPVPAPATV